MTTSRLRSKLPAGLVDSGAASLASFLVGLLAIWTLSTGDLGIYAVFFSAFLIGTYVPRHLVLVPVEMASVEYPRSQRGALVAGGIRVGIGPGLAGVMAIALAAIASLSLASSALLIPMTVTASLATFLSPLQDHVRRMLHLADRSWQAANVSIVQLAVVGAMAGLLLGPLSGGEIAPGWIPFGSLVVGNAASLVYGMVVTLRASDKGSTNRLTFAELSKPGRWLMLSAVSTKGAAFVAASLITNIAGPEVMGYAEAARIAAQPLMVLGIGLQDVMSPRLMEAAHQRDAEAGIRSERIFLVLFWILGLGYLSVAAFDWVGNPMAVLVPTAYVVPGLAAMSIVANLAVSAVYPYRLELMGGRWERPLARVDAGSGVAPLLAALTAATTLSFARPLGLAAQGLIQFLGYRRTRGRMFGQTRVRVPS